MVAETESAAELPQNAASKRHLEEATSEGTDHHCQQGLHNGYEISDKEAFERLLKHNSAKEREYRSRQNERKTVCHWGQRKLMLAEVEFLTQFHGLASTVVYAGAAPGLHMPKLAELFPSLRFVLVDPRPMADTVASCRAAIDNRIEVRQQLFTEEMAREFVGLDALLISDVRTSDDIREPSEEEVRADMELQRAWHEAMQPVASSLKFRLPWGSGETAYLEGDIFLPVWGPVTTTECRLFVLRGAGSRTYDNGRYERQMFHFNTHQRIAKYTHSHMKFFKCSCYDCTAEVHILTVYGRTIRGQEDSSLVSEVEKLSLELNKACHRDHQRPRTLFDPNPDPEERKRKIRKRQSTGK